MPHMHHATYACRSKITMRVNIGFVMLSVIAYTCSVHLLMNVEVRDEDT